MGGWKMWMRACLFGVALGAVACGSGERSASGTEVDVATLKQAIKVSKALRKNPDDAKSILDTAKLSRSSFEAMMYQVAADPIASAKYVEALEASK